MVSQESKTATPPPPPGAPGAPAWLARANEFGERHATAIISASTGLIILIVLIFAKYYYDKSQVERAEQELAVAETVDRLAELKKTYSDTPVAPRILFRLANKHYDEGKLEEARKEYQEFQSRFPADPLQRRVTAALASLERNVKFDTQLKEARLKEHLLEPHPRALADSKPPALLWGPVESVAPAAEIEVAGGVVKVELFETDAPKSVGAFMKLAEQKAFDGTKVDVAADRVTLQAASESPIEAEPSKRPTVAGAIILAKKDGSTGSLASRISVLLKDAPELKDVAVIGRVTDGLPLLQTAKKDDVVKAVRILKK